MCSKWADRAMERIFSKRLLNKIVGEKKMASETAKRSVGIRLNGLQVNASQKEVIGKIKSHAAELITVFEEIRDSDSADFEVRRAAALAKTKAEEASMWGVKATTLNLVD